MKRGFTFIELMVVVMLIAGFTMFAVPKWQHGRIMQGSARSGANLKSLNSALQQWSLDKGGPPEWKSSGEVEVATASIGYTRIDSNGQKEWLQDVFGPYLEITVGLYESPHRSSSYFYGITDQGTGKKLRGVVVSALNGVDQYEPQQKDGNEVMPYIDGVQNQVQQDMVNGYEDAGFFINGMPEREGDKVSL